MIRYMYYSGSKKTITKGESLNYPMPSNSDFVWILMERPDEKEIAKLKILEYVEETIMPKLPDRVPVKYNPPIYLFDILDWLNNKEGE